MAESFSNEAAREALVCVCGGYGFIPDYWDKDKHDFE